MDPPMTNQPIDQPHPGALACTDSNVSGTKRVHESSDSNKEHPLNDSFGATREELKIVPTKSNKGVWTKVTNKKGKRGESEALLTS